MTTYASDPRTPEEISSARSASLEWIVSTYVQATDLVDDMIEWTLTACVSQP